MNRFDNGMASIDVWMCVSMWEHVVAVVVFFFHFFLEII